MVKTPLKPYTHSYEASAMTALPEKVIEDLQKYGKIVHVWSFEARRWHKADVATGFVVQIEPWPVISEVAKKGNPWIAKRPNTVVVKLTQDGQSLLNYPEKKPYASMTYRDDLIEPQTVLAWSFGNYKIKQTPRDKGSSCWGITL